MRVNTIIGMDHSSRNSPTRGCHLTTQTPNCVTLLKWLSSTKFSDSTPTYHMMLDIPNIPHDVGHASLIPRPLLISARQRGPIISEIKAGMGMPA